MAASSCLFHLRFIRATQLLSLCSITLAPTPWLDGKHTIFGRVKSGLRVVQRMGLVKTGAEDRPLEQVKIRTARVLEEDEEAG